MGLGTGTGNQQEKILFMSMRCEIWDLHGNRGIHLYLLRYVQVVCRCLYLSSWMSEVSDGRSPVSLDTNIAVIIKSIEQFSFSFALSQGLGDRQFLFCVSKPPERDPQHV